VDLARVDLVEERHHDERVEDDGEVLVGRGAERLAAAIHVEYPLAYKPYHNNNYMTAILLLQIVLLLILVVVPLLQLLLLLLLLLLKLRQRRRRVA